MRNTTVQTRTTLFMMMVHHVLRRRGGGGVGVCVVPHYPLPQILHCVNEAVVGRCLLIAGAAGIAFTIQKRQSQKTGKAQVSNNYVVGNDSTTNVLAAIRRAGIPS